MDRLPPKLIRRLVIAPLGLVLLIAVLAVSPLLLLTAAIADLFLPGNWRTLRLVGFLVAYVALDIVSMLVLFVLWPASGFGLWLRGPAMQKAHYALMRWWLRTIDRVTRSLFHLRIHIEERPVPRAGPILVFCRHAGPGNSLMLIGTLLVGFRRQPRIVMLAKLQWDPLFDIMLNRLPNRFIRHDPARRDLYINAITGLARGLGEEDAFVLFPEGKDFTPRVRKRAIEYLKGKGHDAAAERAERMTHVLPPRHNGVMAAIEGAKDADIVFVAHALLEDIGSFKDLWGRIPLEHPVRTRYWRVPPEQIPLKQDELIEWLYQWWEKIDQWIAEHTATPS